jgi:hypothetical protein
MLSFPRVQNASDISPSSFDHSINIWWRGSIWSLLRNFLHFPVASSVLVPDSPLNTLFWHPVCSSLRTRYGRAMAQAVSRRPLSEEVRVRDRVSQREICGGQSVTGVGFFSEFLGFSPSVSFHRGSQHVYITWRINNTHVGRRSSEKSFYPIDMNKMTYRLSKRILKF